TPWLRSTTPLACGRRGGFQSSRSPRPTSHNASGGGRSLHEPHGEPLSTRNASGNPQRRKPARSCCWTWPRGTWVKCPWGEDDGLQDRPGTLINHAQPRDQLAAGQGLLLGGVHLPDGV